MKILAAHQPAIHPWLGYLDRIARADVFIILGGVQFERNSFTNRNQIVLNGEPHWLTVPLKMKGHTSKPISAMEINQLVPWRRKHLGTIRQAYGNAVLFEKNWPKIEALYENKFKVRHFMEAAASNLVFWLHECGLEHKLPTMQFDHQRTVKTEELIGLCKMHECDTYLSGPFGRDYLVMERFEKENISVQYHEPDVKPYSIIHHWFNDGELPWKAVPENQSLS